MSQPDDTAPTGVAAIAGIVQAALGAAEGGEQPSILAPPPPANDDGGTLDDINANHALVLMGSRAVVLRESAVGPIQDRVKLITLDAFKAYYANRSIRRVRTEVDDETGETKEIVTFPPLAPAWLSWKKRRTYDGVEFRPGGGGDGTPGYFNLWRGFACAPDPAPAAERARKYQTFRDHLVTNICDGDAQIFRWMWHWLAHLVQRPRERVGTAIVLRGKMGTGKTVMGDIIGSLFPSHYFLVDDPRYLVGQFNAHMASCILLQVDEGFWAGDKAAEGRLKGLVTAPIQMIEAKGVDPIRLENYVRLLFSSNESWVVPAGMDERRFAVLDVAAHAKENHGYFAELYREINAGGREALLADLMAVNLDADDAPNLRVIPKTGALLEQKIRSLEPIPAWWHGRLIDGAQTHRSRFWRPWVPTTTLHNDYIRTSERVGVRRKASETEFGIALRKFVPNLRVSRRTEEVEEFDEAGRPTTVTRRVRCYEFPNLAECREAFAEALRQPLDWAGESGETSKISDDPALADEDGL